MLGRRSTVFAGLIALTLYRHCHVHAKTRHLCRNNRGEQRWSFEPLSFRPIEVPRFPQRGGLGRMSIHLTMPSQKGETVWTTDTSP